MGLARARLIGLWPRSSQWREEELDQGVRVAVDLLLARRRLGDRGEEEALLALEVAGDQRRVDPGALADLPRRRALVSDLVEELPRGPQQRPAGRL